MSFLEKILHTIKGTANDVADNIESANLGTNARQSVRDLDEQLTKAENALVEVRAEAEILKGKHEAVSADVAKWLQAATNAAGKDDGLARECLAKKATAAATLKAVDDALAKFQPTVDTIEQHITQLRSQKDSMANDADLIGVRSDVADVEMKTAKILGAIGNGTPSLAGAAEALAKKEAKAHAMTQITAERTGSDLESRVAALNTGSSIDDELAALKANK